MTSSTEARGNKYKVVEYCYLSRILVNKQKKKIPCCLLVMVPDLHFFYYTLVTNGVLRAVQNVTAPYSFMVDIRRKYVCEKA